MKKAILLLGMIIFVAGVIYLKDADADTVLIKHRPVESYMEQLVRDTEELQIAELEVETEMETETESVEESEPIVVVSADTADSYAFLRLSLEEQKVYLEILSSLLAYEQETTLSTREPSRIDRAFQCVMLDHPEIFYIDGYKYTEYKSDDKVEKIVFSGNYLYNAAQIEERRTQIDSAVSQILADVPDTEDEYQIVKYVYETVIRHTEYDIEAEDNQNICSVFLNGRSVCQGYAKAIQYLLQELGMEVCLVTGTVREGDGHAWDLVLVNDNWYYLDATWGDAYYLLGMDMQDTSMLRENSVNYDYLCVTAEQIEQTHTIEMPIAMPQCVENKDNYYVREGLYFEHYDEEKIGSLFGKAVEAGKETVTIKCSDNAVYEVIWKELIEEQKVFQFIQTENGTIAYTDNPEQGSITFWL